MATLFDLPVTSDGGPPLSQRCTPAPCGTGPEGEHCRTCKHATKVGHHDAKYWKCGKMVHAWTRGAGSDIRLKWDACREWEGE